MTLDLGHLPFAIFYLPSAIHRSPPRPMRPARRTVPFQKDFSRLTEHIRTNPNLGAPAPVWHSLARRWIPPARRFETQNPKLPPTPASPRRLVSAKHREDGSATKAGTRPCRPTTVD